MATKFLRKIIMEELQKELEEQAIPGAAPGQTYTPVASGVIGKSKSAPKPGSIDFMGPEEPKRKSSPKRIATLKLQKKLAELGFLDKKYVTGTFGPKTTDASNAALSASGAVRLNAADVQKFTTQDINTMVAALPFGNKGRASEEDHLAGAVASARKETFALPTQFRKGESSPELSTTIKDSVPSKAEKLGKTRSTAGEESNIELSDRVTTKRRPPAN